MTGNHCHCEEAQRADAAIRIPRPEAPLCKGSCHGFAVTEGLSEVDSPFGGDLCSDFHPSLATAAQTLRCAPLTWAIAAALRNHP